MNGKIGGLGWSRVAAILVVAVLLVSALGVALLLSSGQASAVSLRSVWLDQEDNYGLDQVTELAENADTVFASAKGIGPAGKELFTVRAYEGSSGKDKWASYVNLGSGKSMASAVASSGTGVAAVGVGEVAEGREMLIVAYFNAMDGTVLWNVTFDAGMGVNVANDVACFDGMIYVAGSGRNQAGADEFLVLAYDAASGHLVWSKHFVNGGGENAALALIANPNGVFVTGYVEDLEENKAMFTANLDLKVGRVLWQDTFDAGKGDNKGTSILSANGIVVVAGVCQVSEGYVTLIRSYDILTGALVWKIQEAIISAPTDLAVSGSELLVTGISGDHYSVQCFDISTGSLRWQNQVLNQGMFNFKAAVDVENDVVSTAFFSQNISDDADYTWEIDICQYRLSDGNRLSGNLTTGLGKTSMNVDILIHDDKAYFTTSTEKVVSLPQLMSVGSASGSTVVAVEGRNITVNGENFIFKGINYSPAPIGSNNADIPWGDWFQHYWASIYERDIPKIKDMGANVIKVYSMTGFRWDDPMKSHIAHTDFYDQLYKAGIYVIPSVYTTMADIKSYNPQNWDAQDVVSQWKIVLAEAKDNPAVLGYTIGNEINGVDHSKDSAYWGKVNDLIGHIKKMSPDKITIVPLVDNTYAGGYVMEVWEQDATMTNLDVWGVNSYRGTIDAAFDSLFTTYRQNSSKPLLITEFGPSETTRDSGGKMVAVTTPYVGKYLSVHWTGRSDSIMNNTDVCSGGFIFEWTDEWYKKPNTPVWEQNGGDTTNRNWPGGWNDEEGFGLYGIALNGRAKENPDPGKPDLLTPRPSVAIMAALWKT